MQGKEVKRAMKNGQGKEAKGKRRKEGRRRRQCSCSSPPPSPRIKAAGRFSFYSCTGGHHTYVYPGIIDTKDPKPPEITLKPI